jgi:AI-2 transport protein TqsA
VIRTTAVIVAVGVVIALARYFQIILTPLIVATFLMLLIDAAARVMHRLAPAAPAWVRYGVAGAIILAGFFLVGGALALEAPAFAARMQALGPRLSDVVVRGGAVAGLKVASVEELLKGIGVWNIVGRVFAAAQGVVSFAVLVVIYLGFLLASRATFGRKVESLFDTDARRAGAHRVAGSVRNAVEQYVKLQTVKAGLTAIAAFAVMALTGSDDATIVAFVVFLAVYVPIIGPAIGVVLPTVMTLAQFGDVGRAAIVGAVMEVTVFVNGNVVMPKLQSDQLNLDPLLVLMSLGFWGLILGAPGVVLSTPLTVTVMAVAAEFEGTRWLAVILSKDGHPTPEAKAP